MTLSDPLLVTDQLAAVLPRSAGRVDAGGAWLDLVARGR